MKDLTGLTALTEKDNTVYTPVWLFELDADEPNTTTTTKYWGHRKLTLNAVNYLDELAGWPQFGWAKIRVGGGLAQVATLRFSLRNEEKASQLVDTFFLENDEFRSYLLFATGSETTTDRVELFRGVVETLPFNLRTWDLDVIDGSDKDFREIPQAKINLIDYVDASFDALGKVVPEAFGDLNIGPYDDAGAEPLMAPCRNTNIFTQEYTSALHGLTYGDVFQYYRTAKRYGQVSSITQNGSVFTVDSSARTMRLGGVLQSDTNDVAGYKAIMDGNSSNGIAIVNTDNLDILIGGVSKIGTLTQLDLVIDATGGYDYDALLGGVSKVSGSDTGDATINISSGPTDHIEDWDFERYEVQIDGTGAATINQVYLLLTYDDQQSQDRQELTLFQKVTGGWNDLAANYADGSQIAGGGGLTNCADLLEAVLRGANLMGMTEAEVNLTAFDAAVSARSGWNAAFAFESPVNIAWLNEFCFQMGLHLYKDFQGKWKAVAQDKTTAPVHTFLGDTHIAVKNPTSEVGLFEPDVSYSRTPIRDLINEVALRYSLDRGTGEYAGVQVASGRARTTGTCSVLQDTQKLTDGSGDFVNKGVAVNDTVYVEGDKDYTVSGIDSATVLSLTAPIGDVRDSVAGTNYHIGPNLDGRMVRSQSRYKTENPLGKRQDSFTEVGGYTSDIIVDSTTASNFVEQIVTWRSQRRLQVEFAAFLNAVDVELGDFCWFDQAWLPLSKKPFLLGTITAGVNSTVTTFDSAENGLLRAGDAFYLDTETVEVVSVDYSGTEIVVTRGEDNTIAAAHTSGTAIYRLNLVRWEVTGIKPDPEKQQFRLQIQETPPGYLPTGIVVVAGYPAWDAATGAQRVAAGWATLQSGRVKDEDEYSAISYVGPDSGTYTNG